MKTKPCWVFLLGWTACSEPPTPSVPPASVENPGRFAVAFQANVQGDIEPCG